MTPVALLEQADRLRAATLGWGDSRWATPPRALPGRVGATAATRGDVLFHLVQALADLSAAAEHRSGRAVPRLDSDLGLPDQLRVMVHDLVAAAPADDIVAAAMAELRLHRAEVDGARIDASALQAGLTHCPLHAAPTGPLRSRPVVPPM
jgi:hypothetical protein